MPAGLEMRQKSKTKKTLLFLIKDRDFTVNTMCTWDLFPTLIRMYTDPYYQCVLYACITPAQIFKNGGAQATVPSDILRTVVYLMALELYKTVPDILVQL